MTTPVALLPARRAVAAEVRAACARLRVTQASLAPMLGLSQQALSRRMVGDLPFDVDQLFAVAETLNIPISDLMGNAAQASELGLELQRNRTKQPVAA